MMRVGRMDLLVRLSLVFLGVFVCGEVLGQSFPYSVPQAPEFDSRGNVRGSDGQDAQDPPVQERRPRRRPAVPTHETREYYQTARPYAPQPPQPPQSARPASAPPPHYGVAPRPTAPQQMQPQPDCTQYPMMIARAQSEVEMQMTAKQYLTCLLKLGWPMEQARRQVIQTIEATFRMAR